MSRANDQQIKASLNAWAVNLGIHRDALTRRLHEARINWETGDDISATDIFSAMLTDKDAAIARKSNADAEAKERENRKAEGELFELPAIEKKLWSDLLQPLRLELEQLPAIYSQLCNPENPDVAKKVLGNFVERIKLNIKEPKVEK